MNSPPHGLGLLPRALVVAGLCITMVSNAHADAQSDRIQALEKGLENSLKLIEVLSARLAELERTKGMPKPVAAVAAPTPAPTDQAQEIARLQESVAQLSDSLSKRSNDTGLPVHGFADAGGAWSGGNDPIKLRGFNGGTLDLYLTPQFGDRVKSLIELAVEYGRDGSVGIDMERLQIGYTVSDSLTAWVGRFHTPFGLWNTSFHHGANLQTSITRPRFIDFEDKGGIIPAHSVGLWGSGKTDLGAGKLRYDGYLTNGPSIRGRVLDFNAYTDDTSNKMLGFNLGYSPRGPLNGLTLGAHGFASTVAAVDAAGVALSQTKLRMLGGYFGYDADDWEAIGEFYRFRNGDVATGASNASSAWFTQIGRTFGLWTPYVRLENANLQAGDRYFASQQSGRGYRRSSAGLRYALDPRSSFKFELSHTSETATTLIDDTGSAVPFAGATYRRAAFQYSVAF